MNYQNEPGLIAALRAMREAGRRSVELLRYLDSRGLDTIEMMDCFREAFGLDSYAVGPIGGWFADGTGELDDDQVSALLDAVIDPRAG
jgi:hypothetical protein